MNKIINSPISIVLTCALIGTAAGIPLNMWIRDGFKPRYERWVELSPLECTFMIDCTRMQPYAVCLENVYQMRQIGIAP